MGYVVSVDGDKGVALKISQGGQTPKNVFQGGGNKRPKNLKNLKNPHNFKTFAIFLDF